MRKHLRWFGPDDGTNPTGGEPQAGNPPAHPQPQAGATPSSDPQAGTGTTTTQQKSADDYERMLADLRKENAGHRTKLKKFEDEEAQRTQAQLTEQQKLEKRATDAENALAEREQAYQARLLDAEIRSQAAQLGIKYPDKAVRLIDTADIKADDAQMSTKVKDALTALLKEMPELGPQAGQQRQAPTSGGATNPSRSQSAGEVNDSYVRDVLSGKIAWGTLTQEQRTAVLNWQARKPYRF